MAMRPNQPVGGGLEWYDFINPLNYFNGDFYNKLQGTVAGGAQQMGQTLNAMPQAVANIDKGATMASNAVTQATAPTRQQPQDIYRANFGTFTGDAIGKLRAMGMLPSGQENADQGRYAEMQRQNMQNAQQDYRGRLSALMNKENPYSQNNSGYLASQSQIVGQQGQSLLNGLRSQQASNALNGIKQDSGLAQNQQNRFRTQDALSRNAALTGLETQRFDKAAGWDNQNRQFGLMANQAINAGDFGTFDRLKQSYDTQYEQNRQQPFDALRMAGGVQGFEHQGRMNPLEYLYAQGRNQGQQLNNAGQGLQNVRYGMENNAYGQTMQSGVDAQNSANRLSYLGNTQQYQMGNDLYNDPNTRKNMYETLRNNAQTANVQSGYNLANAYRQPWKDVENEIWDRTGKQVGMLKNILPMAGGMGG